jgi:hypothetical protein
MGFCWKIAAMDKFTEKSVIRAEKSVIRAEKSVIRAEKSVIPLTKFLSFFWTGF